MSSQGALNAELSKKTSFLGLKLWVLIGISVGAFIVLILGILSVWVTFRRRSRRSVDKFSLSQIPNVSKDIKVDKVGVQSFNDHPESVFLSVNDKSSDRNSEKMLAHLGMSKSSDPDNISQCSSIYHHERGLSSHSGEEGSSGTVRKPSALSYGGIVTASPLVGLPEISHLGWGHWFTLRDLDLATDHFSAENVIGEGGYGVVYRGRLINGTEVAVKKLLNNLGQAEKEFRVEVEAIGHVRHKNLVRLLGYCIEGVHRLAYLHEAIEPKVVHRDIKSSNILIDDDFNAKVSDFGLAKLLGSGESHITTRVMGTFGYVAPEYANTGLLNERSDIYSFGVLLLEAVTGRDPVDYGRPANEVNLVEWLKMMVGTRRAEEVVDPNLEVRPTTRALKRALLVSLRCVDPDADKRPKMSQVVQMLEADEYPFREDRRNRKSRTASMEIESMKESTGVDSKVGGITEQHN
ncbi:probable receptor-like protein kinase At2g42960 isoform X2 [Durio zibethinus]|uniref:non-specific serine/threonine protein kinase n=1 Tax=Durio zibethinus TaxID=66656 RepID=A0A6P6BC26_DURZI|nr:probable receptor-like protein kinase At2g42960 isoform X2 [Durio zibethinus]